MGSLGFLCFMWWVAPVDAYRVNCYNAAGQLVWSDTAKGEPDFDEGLWTWEDVNGVDTGTNLDCGYFNASELAHAQGLAQASGVSTAQSEQQS